MPKKPSSCVASRRRDESNRRQSATVSSSAADAVEANKSSHDLQKVIYICVLAEAVGMKVYFLVFRFSRFAQTVADSFHTARRDETRPFRRVDVGGGN